MPDSRVETAIHHWAAHFISNGVLLTDFQEVTAAYEQRFLARGMATLAFDGPGQGESEYEFAILGEYEVAVVDWVEKRNDVDDGDHVANNRGYRWRTQSADWMARQLGVPQS